MIDGKHEFGSADTQTKLDCLQRYLQAYSVALQNKGFARIYIDAFAGTGNRTVTHAALPIFENGETKSVEVNTKGSAKIALDIEPEFTSVVLIEQDEARSLALKKMVEDRGESRVHVRTGDANAIVRRLCSRYDWHKEKMRGVIFLDPYGMEVNWSTVEAIAATEALDCWYFFPLSGLYRNAPLDARRLDDVKINTLNRVLGTDTWQNDWYRFENKTYDLFGETDGMQRDFDVDQIENWVGDRLKSVFKGAVLPPLRLRHANKAPMASLFFAMSNPDRKAVGLGTKIANHILSAGRSSQSRSR